MHRNIRLAAPIAGLVLSLAWIGETRAADQQKVIDQIQTSNDAAVAAYESGNFKKMKTVLLKAIALAGENDIATHSALVKTYMLAGVLYVDGLEDRETGIRYFARALKIAPDSQIPSGMGTTPVKSAFKQARSDLGSGSAEAEAPPPPKEKERERAPAAEEEEAPPPKQSKAELAAERKRAEAEAREAEREAREGERLAREERQARDERDKIRELERVSASETKEKERLLAEKDRLQKEKNDRERQAHDAKSWAQQAEKEKAHKEKQLAEVLAKLQQTEKDRADKDRQLTETKARLSQLEKDKADRDKWLADVKERERREREAKELLQKEKAERDKQLADAKARLQQLEKDKADRDKWLAETKERERKERETREKLEKQRQYAELDERERKGRAERERAEREKLAEAPELPGRIPEPLYCALPDEAQAGMDLYAHCVPQPHIRAKAIVFYYRSSGVVQYNALVMERTKDGWYTAEVPGSKVSGKLLQYYAEAHDDRDKLTAANGKAGSPNVLTLRAAGSTPMARGRRPR